MMGGSISLHRLQIASFLMKWGRHNRAPSMKATLDRRSWNTGWKRTFPGDRFVHPTLPPRA